MSKTLTLTELSQLKKFMGMTTSVHDGEALNAIRKANGVLKGKDLTWADVLARTVQINDEVQANTEIPLNEQIRRAFDELRGNIETDFVKFIESLEKQWDDGNGYLTPNQRRPLFDAVRRLREKRKRDD